jgi:hypothetical protein
MKRYATIALAALLLSALAPRPAAAFRDCCIVHTVGASMSTISVVEMSPGDLEEWAGRLGFSAEPRAEDGVTQIHLEASTLLSLAAPGTPFLGLPALRIRPSVTPIMVCTTQGRTWWPPVRSPSVPHANGASRILDCFAVAASAEGAAQEFKANPLCRGFGRDERCAEDAAEGATECGFEVDEWRVRVLVPEDSTGIAARWLDEETAGWIGIVVDVRDLLLAELALKAQGTEFERIETARGAGLLVDDRPRGARPGR